MLQWLFKKRTASHLTGSDWHQSNLAALRQRTAFQANLPQGIALQLPSSPRRLYVQRQGDQLQLFFHSVNNNEVMSRMDVHDPLNLVSPYTQAMMLSLLWKPAPKRVYMLGFGAGRVPMILHHYFPDTQIDCTELDKDVLALAQSHFGITCDERLHVTIEDGRYYLEAKTQSANYDIILIDAFCGTGSSPPALSTLEFHQLCKRHLATGGILAVNMLFSDTAFHDKLFTLQSAFKYTFILETNWGGSVLLSSDSALPEKCQAIAKQIEKAHGFTFPFAKHVSRLKPVRIDTGRLLRDKNNSAI